MLAVRRPSNHAFARGGDGVDREGHLLTFADLGRDRGSFDWLSPVVFSGLVLHVELCDRQRNRAGGVTDGGGAGEIGSLGTHLGTTGRDAGHFRWLCAQWSGWGSTMAVVGTPAAGPGDGSRTVPGSCGRRRNSLRAGLLQYTIRARQPGN